VRFGIAQRLAKDLAAVPEFEVEAGWVILASGMLSGVGWEEEISGTRWLEEAVWYDGMA